mmetsp:Transcript_31350/g.72931  ORF Transcript_31350/g.72931 Transcript_31350/m.72931 type:complete len:250 (-) Transcript_31350:20-769(-)
MGRRSKSVCNFSSVARRAAPSVMDASGGSVGRCGIGLSVENLTRTSDSECSGCAFCLPAVDKRRLPPHVSAYSCTTSTGEKSVGGISSSSCGPAAAVSTEPPMPASAESSSSRIVRPAPRTRYWKSARPRKRTDCGTRATIVAVVRGAASCTPGAAGVVRTRSSNAAVSTVSPKIGCAYGSSGRRRSCSSVESSCLASAIASSPPSVSSARSVSRTKPGYSTQSASSAGSRPAAHSVPSLIPKPPTDRE